MNRYLTIGRKMELNPMNRLKRDLHKRHKYLRLNSIGHRYKIKAGEIQKLKRISASFSIKEKKNEKRQDETDSLIHNPVGFREDQLSLQSFDRELADIKKLLSFLVQQNEQSRQQQKSMKEQNEEVLEEINNLKETLNEIKEGQDAEYEREYDSFTTVYKSLLYIEEKVNHISSKSEDKKLKGNWQKIFEK